MAQIGAATAESQQTTKGVASELLDQSKRLGTVVDLLETALVNAGLRQNAPKESIATDAPEPADFRWLVNDSNRRVRIATNELEELTAVVQNELA